jgi:hypothetical protein
VHDGGVLRRVEQDQIGEGASDIDADELHQTLRSRTRAGREGLRRRAVSVPARARAPARRGNGRAPSAMA